VVTTHVAKLSLSPFHGKMTIALRISRCTVAVPERLALTVWGFDHENPQKRTGYGEAIRLAESKRGRTR
jgi:hypothetical protein